MNYSSQFQKHPDEVLANENFPKPSIVIMRNSGLDVVSVQESNPSISDKEVVEWANRENRIILTFDKDYGEIVFRNKIPCSVVFFRRKGKSPKDAGDYLLKILLLIKWDGYFTVIDDNGIRQRELKF
jgi:predicted nuclease of predicted toxin-antitoxin system